MGFDGVFLDKIRFSSFGNGFEAAMGCFCERCGERYQKSGIDMNEFSKRMKLTDKSFLLPDAVENGRYRFADPLIDKVYEVRSEIITDAVNDLAGHFRGLGMKVGLDVYAPMFSYWVGQDIGALSENADFIKTMLYRVTQAPAGIPYEAACMVRQLRLRGCESEGVLQRLWNIGDLCSPESLRRQIKAVSGARCPVYAGFEINAKRDICHADLNYVLQTAEVLERENAGRAVLSWDVLSDTQDFLESLADL